MKRTFFEKVRAYLGSKLIAFGMIVVPRDLRIYYIEMMSNWGWIVEQLNSGNEVHLIPEEIRPNFQLLKNDKDE